MTSSLSGAALLCNCLWISCVQAQNILSELYIIVHSNTFGYIYLDVYFLSVYSFTPADNSRIKQERVFGHNPSSVAIKTTNMYSVRKLRLCVNPCKQKYCSERRANTPARFLQPRLPVCPRETMALWKQFKMWGCERSGSCCPCLFAFLYS